MAAATTHPVSSALPVAVVPDSPSPLSPSARPSSARLRQREITDDNNIYIYEHIAQFKSK